MAILNLQIDDIISISTFCGVIQCFIMAEDFQKYKSILDREWEEFKQQLKREVSAFLSFQVDKEAIF